MGEAIYELDFISFQITIINKIYHCIIRKNYLSLQFMREKILSGNTWVPE